MRGLFRWIVSIDAITTTRRPWEFEALVPHVDTLCAISNVVKGFDKRVGGRRTLDKASPSSGSFRLFPFLFLGDLVVSNSYPARQLSPCLMEKQVASRVELSRVKLIPCGGKRPLVLYKPKDFRLQVHEALKDQNPPGLTKWQVSRVLFLHSQSNRPAWFCLNDSYCQISVRIVYSLGPRCKTSLTQLQKTVLLP